MLVLTALVGCPKAGPAWVDAPAAGPCPPGAERRERSLGGNVEEACRTPDGVAHGPYQVRYASGRIATAGACAEGRKQGEWITWTVAGEPIERIVYAQGVPVDGDEMTLVLFEAARASGDEMVLAAWSDCPR